MEQIYTLEEAKKLGDQAILSIESGNVLVTADGCRLVEIESNMWAKVNSGQAAPIVVDNQHNEDTGIISFDNILYVSASHHDGGVIVRPLYVFAGGQWVNISTGKKIVFNGLAR